jgi:CubicO group peptidase (beta-lactamase class C family)
LAQPDRPKLRFRLSASLLAQLGAVAVGIGVFVFLMSHSIAPYFANRPSKGAPESDFKAQLDRSVPAILSNFDIPGVVVATVVNGKPSRTYAYGYANIERRQPMRTDTVFRVASLSKSLTAWGVLRLVQDGKVSLDAPAERFVQRWPVPPSTFPAEAVTVRRLLNHTSGLNPGGDSYRQPDQPAQSAADLLRLGGKGAEPAALILPAGKRFLYSVPGYTILQMMIEDQSHRPFADYMLDTVIRPLGMGSSSYRWDAALRARTATPYVSDLGPSPVDIPQDQAADSLFSTAPDLARFIAAPLPDKTMPPGGGVLSAASVAQLYDNPADVPSLQLAGFAPDQPTLGYFLEPIPGQPMIVTNGGYDPGWASRFYFAPATGDGLVILTNSDHAQPIIAHIASVWSSWRGLPPTGMTRTYRTLGSEAGAVLSLVVTLALSLGAGLLLEMRSDAKRRFAFKRIAPATNALECILAICTVGLWVFAYKGVRGMPTLNTVGTAVISLFVIVVIARIILPVRSGYSDQADREGPDFVGDLADLRLPTPEPADPRVASSPVEPSENVAAR